ncbi:hypothetical protein EBU94_07455 [bacterium]|nr:hypothetical protein [bacterium]
MVVDFKSKEPNFAGMIKAIKEIVENHEPRIYHTYNCIEARDCICGDEFFICQSCGRQYPCPTINILREYDIL